MYGNAIDQHKVDAPINALKGRLDKLRHTRVDFIMG